jgi:hypothetical protein
VDELAKIPFIALGNKIDAPSACSEEEFRFRTDHPQGLSVGHFGRCGVPDDVFKGTIPHKSGIQAIWSIQPMCSHTHLLTIEKLFCGYPDTSDAKQKMMAYV